MSQTADIPVLDRADDAPVLAKRPTAPPRAEDDGLRERVQKLRIGGPGTVAKGGGMGRVAWLPWLLCGALALAWAGWAIRFYQNKPADAPGGAVVSSGGGPAATGSASRAAGGTVALEVRGYLITEKTITVSPIDVGGKVLELRPPPKSPKTPFAEGVTYEQGDVIAVLDDASYKAARDEAAAALVAAEKRLDAAKQKVAEQDPKAVRKIEFDQAEAELAEAKAMELRAVQELKRQAVIKDTVALTPREYQQAEADAAGASAKVARLQAGLDILKAGPRDAHMLGAKADVAAADADVAAAKARLGQAEWRLGNCTIRAPISGSVLTKKAEIGNLVNPMAFTGGGGICDLADLKALEVDMKVAEREIAKVRVGQACRIKVDAYPDRPYTGTVSRVMPIANRGDNTVNVRVKLDQASVDATGTPLKPDMGTTVTFLGDDAK